MIDFRIITYSLNDLILDHEVVAENLNHACLRADGRYRITGVCQTFNQVVFPCERVTGDAPPSRYVLAPVNGDNNEVLSADLLTRWRSGFTTIGMIKTGHEWLALFELPVRKANGVSFAREDAIT